VKGREEIGEKKEGGARKKSGRKGGNIHLLCRNVGYATVTVQRMPFVLQLTDVGGELTAEWSGVMQFIFHRALVRLAIHQSSHTSHSNDGRVTTLKAVEQLNCVQPDAWIRRTGMWTYVLQGAACSAYVSANMKRRLSLYEAS